MTRRTFVATLPAWITLPFVAFKAKRPRVVEWAENTTGRDRKTLPSDLVLSGSSCSRSRAIDHATLKLWHYPNGPRLDEGTLRDDMRQIYRNCRSHDG